MKKIPLTQGKFAIIDDEDFELVSQYKWRVCCRKNQKYAATEINNHKVYMHRLILGINGVQEIDHINGNGLNNCRKNLRHCSRSQNNMNRHKSWGTSEYKGVSWYKQRKKWRAIIKYNKKYKHLGYFDSEIEAAKVYDNAALEHFGKFAQLNFPKVVTI